MSIIVFMDWKSLIASLAEFGVTQKEIGEAVGLSQPAISDLARGRTTRVEWEAGEKLRAFYEQKLVLRGTEKKAA